MRELQAEGEGLRRRLVSEAKERHALVAKQNHAQMRAAGRLALRLGVKQLHTVFRAWCVVWLGSGFGLRLGSGLGLGLGSGFGLRLRLGSGLGLGLGLGLALTLALTLKP